MHVWPDSSRAASYSFSSRHRRRLRQLVLGSLGGWLFTGAVLVHADPGALTQLPGLDGCISETGSGGTCTDGKGLAGLLTSVAVSPDGKHVYGGAAGSGGVAVFTRNKQTGVLTQLPGLNGCISETGSSGACTDGKGLDRVEAITVSPDGKHVYVATSSSNSVAAFTRNKQTGALTQLPGLDGCISEDGSGGNCTVGKALVFARFVSVSPDGKHVYVAAADSDAVAVFARNKTTGALTQLPGLDGCISKDGSGGNCAVGKAVGLARAVVVSKDGKHVYVAAGGSSGAVAVFARDKTTGVLTQLPGLDGCISDNGSGPCTDGKGLAGAQGITVSQNGKHVYVAAFNGKAVAVFARDKTTGAITQLPGLDGCISEDGSGGNCADGKGLDGANGITVSKDGKHVYVAARVSSAMAVFARDKTTGVLTQLPGLEGCISETGSSGACTDGKGLNGVVWVTVSPDGKHIYGESLFSAAVTAFSREK